MKIIKHFRAHRDMSLNGHDKNARSNIEKTEVINKYFSPEFGKRQKKGYPSEGKVLSSP